MKYLITFTFILTGIFPLISSAENHEMNKTTSNVTQSGNPLSDTKTSMAQRKKMAVAHENLAKCLRSNKPGNACMSEMRANKMDMMGYCNMDHSQMRMSNPSKKINK